jgi:dTDP-4-amino-4,6-dideoxygalactose transaminase
LGYDKGSFPIAEKIADTCLSLPIWPGMEFSDVEFISNKLRKFFEKL